MQFPKRTIVIDYDDTLVKSSEIIINILNRKNNTKKTIDDLKDWVYRSIDKTLTSKDVEELYRSTEFWHYVNCHPVESLNDYVKDFFKKFRKEFCFYVLSVGTKENIKQKQNHIDFLKKEMKIDIGLIGIVTDGSKGHRIDKSNIDLSSCYLFIEDNTHAIMSTNASKKILLKNNHEVYWNKTPINQDNIYIVNSFKEIIEMIEFDLKRWNK